MKYRAKIIADSIGPNGVRLTTMEFDIWKPLLAEFNTHGLLSSRNFPSSRARPWAKVREAILENPHIPVFRKNNPGMQAGEPLSEGEQSIAESHWLMLRDIVLTEVEAMGDKDGLNIHKQWLNRLIEPWTTVTGIVTATDWDNFWNLRTELNVDGFPMAQDEFYFMTLAMQKAMDQSEPKTLEPGEWHLPYMVNGDPYSWIVDNLLPNVFDYAAAMIPAGRCATVSYDNLGQGTDPKKDYVRASDVLLPFGHMSVFQHQAQCMPPHYYQCDSPWCDNGVVEMQAIMKALSQTWTGQKAYEVLTPVSTDACWWGQLRGWGQFRKSLPNETKWVSPNYGRAIALDVPELFTE